MRRVTARRALLLVATARRALLLVATALLAAAVTSGLALAQTPPKPPAGGDLGQWVIWGAVALGTVALSTTGQRVEEARMLLRSHPEVRSATAVVDAWTAANTAPSDILPPAVVIAVRRVHAEMRAAAAAAEAAANGGGE